MKQNDFISTHKDFWARMEHLLSQPKKNEVSQTEQQNLPADYRKICHHLSLAELRNYSPALQERLNRIALDGHQLFYSSKSRFIGNAGRFFAVDFPRCVRAHKYYVLVSACLFFVPLLGLIYGIVKDPGLAYSVIDPATAQSYKDMYDPSHHDGPRADYTDIAMFGFYVWNNISIALRTFASGLVLGIGAVFILLFNGISIGAVAGLLTSSGYSDTFWPFVAGHGAFELTAIVLAGASGMKMGFAILMPGQNSRTQALKQAGNAMVPMVYGFVILLVLAAGIEAFWSPNNFFSSVTKYWVGGVLWALVVLYFVFSGRGSDNA